MAIKLIVHVMLMFVPKVSMDIKSLILNIVYGQPQIGYGKMRVKPIKQMKQKNGLKLYM